MFRVRTVEDLNAAVEKIAITDDTLPAPLTFECKEKLVGSKDCISCISLFRELNNRSGIQHLRNRLKKNGYTEHELTHDWDPSTKTWKQLDSKQTEYSVKMTDLKSFITWALQRCRKTKEEKMNILKQFNVELDEKEAEQISGPIENELLSALEKTCPYKIELQYRIDRYRLDAFIPRLRIGIEIDEHGHASYDASEEKEQEQVLRDNNIILIRFNCHQKCLIKPHYELIRIVWERTLSPDFNSFREKYKLI